MGFESYHLLRKMKYVYYKLVRDKIPHEIDKKGGRKDNYKILNDSQYLKELNKKCRKNNTK